MWKDGRTPAGKQRWRCRACNRVAIRARPDTAFRHLKKHFVRWLTGNQSLAEIAHEIGCTRQTLVARFSTLWEECPAPPPAPSKPDHILILDGVYLSGRVNAALVARTTEHVRSWLFTERENCLSWIEFLSHLTPPSFVVSDGQKGLTEAIARCFSSAVLQRCLAHVERYSRIKLSSHPKTQAGRELWALTRSLWRVHTRRQKRRWVRVYKKWERKHESFLKQRSASPTGRGWWYIHRNVRAVRTHIRNALPNLFIFVRHSEVPRTTNHVEGGINSRLKELVHRHRGLSPYRKRVLAANFLSRRSKEKTTRNFT